MGGGLLVRWDEQDETIAALFEICVGLVGFGFHRHGLRFATHVKLHAQTANLHWKLGLPDTGRRKKNTLLSDCSSKHPWASLTRYFMCKTLYLSEWDQCADESHGLQWNVTWFRLLTRCQDKLVSKWTPWFEYAHRHREEKSGSYETKKTGSTHILLFKIKQEQNNNNKVGPL